VSLLSITEFCVTSEVTKVTTTALRDAGEGGYELFALWTGVIQEQRFVVTNVHVPRQYSVRSDIGASVQVPGDELHRLNIWLFQHQQTLGVQVHSHPDAAYHSATDDSFPIVTVLGGLSIVVPHFGRDGVLGAESKAFRLTVGGWKEVDPATRLVRVTG
jgi:hypothetical protein